MPGSVRSLASSQRTAQSKSLTRNATVDETLFARSGSQQTRQQTRLLPKARSEVMIVGKDTVQVKRPPRGARAQQQVATAVIGASQLNDLMDRATLLTPAEQAELSKRREQEREERQRVSKERAERIKAMEEHRRRNAPLSEFEREDKARKEQILARAKEKLDEQNDDARHMNQLLLAAQTVTIRDAQLQEKKFIQMEKEEETRQADMQVEIERLSALKMYEEREQKRLMDQRIGAQVIVEQIKDRQAQRMFLEKQRDKEREVILQQLKSAGIEDDEAIKAKKRAAARLMDEVNRSNQQTLKIKEEKRLLEKLEDQRVLEYQKDKERREREMEEEKKRQAAAKEAEALRLRAQQEKASDKQAELDALRAKRAIEAAERAARTKEQQDKERSAALMEEMRAARIAQQAEKERRLALQAKAEREEFERIVEVQAQQERAEKLKEEENRRIRHEHVAALRQQIDAREEMAQQVKRDYLEEGNIVRARTIAEREKLEQLKQRKIDSMVASGVPQKYCGELMRKKMAM